MDPFLLFMVLLCFWGVLGQVWDLIVSIPDFCLLTYFIPSFKILSKIVSEYDQEIPQSQTADHPVAPRGRAAQPSRDTRKTN